MLSTCRLIKFCTFFAALIKSCPNGWLTWNNYCYLFQQATPSSWWNAEYKCKNDFGGHLASIGGSDENAFVKG